MANKSFCKLGSESITAVIARAQRNRGVISKLFVGDDAHIVPFASVCRR